MYAEHQKLAQCVGTWDARLEGLGMDGKPQVSAGVSVQKLGPGGFWLLDDFTAEMMGMQFTGHGALGFDPEKKVYVQSWIDSTTPMLMVFTGTFDKDGKVLTMSGMGPGMDGKPVKMRNVTTFASADSMTFEMFAPGPDGKEMKMLTITYTRRGEKKAENAGAKK